MQRKTKQVVTNQVSAPMPVVVGASAGGMAALKALVAQLPEDFPAPVFICPDCGGVLWQMAEGKPPRYRCHTGHAFTSAALLAQQTVKIEETLWVALRMFEERQNLLVTMSKNESKQLPSSTSQRAKDSQVHIERIRAMLKATDKDVRGKETG